jgi:hypothetical protein
MAQATAVLKSHRRYWDDIDAGIIYEPAEIIEHPDLIEVRWYEHIDKDISLDWDVQKQKKGSFAVSSDQTELVQLSPLNKTRTQCFGIKFSVLDWTSFADSYSASSKIRCLANTITRLEDVKLIREANTYYKSLEKQRQERNYKRGWIYYKFAEYEQKFLTRHGLCTSVSIKSNQSHFQVLAQQYPAFIETKILHEFQPIEIAESEAS